MTVAKMWQNGWIIGEKDKSYVKFKETRLKGLSVLNRQTRLFEYKPE